MSDISTALPGREFKAPCHVSWGRWAITGLSGGKRKRPGEAAKRKGMDQVVHMRPSMYGVYSSCPSCRLNKNKAWPRKPNDDLFSAVDVGVDNLV